MVSTGPSRFLVAVAIRSSMWAALWRSPRAVSCSASGIVIVVLLRERVVLGEGVRRDPEVAHAGVVGQDDRDGRRRLARAGPLVEQMGDRGSGDGAAIEGLAERALDRTGAMRIEQAGQTCCVRADGLASASQGIEESGGAGARAPQAIAATELKRATLLGGQLFKVGRILDDDAAVIAAAVARELVVCRLRR